MGKSATVCADFLVRQLIELHAAAEWATFAELACGTGAAAGRSIDLYALHLWPSKGFHSVAYEVKISRADFRRELSDPSKRAPWEKLAAECWFAAPAGVIPLEELPEGWGLMEWTGDGWRRPRRAVQRRVEAWPPAFVASIARRSQDPKQVEPVEAWDFLGRPLRSEDLIRVARKIGAMRDARIEAPKQDDDRVRRDRQRVGELAHAVSVATGLRGWAATAEGFRGWLAGRGHASPDTLQHLRVASEAIAVALRNLTTRNDG